MARVFYFAYVIAHLSLILVLYYHTVDIEVFLLLSVPRTFYHF